MPSANTHLVSTGFKRLHQSGNDYDAYYHECFVSSGLSCLSPILLIPSIVLITFLSVAIHLTLVQLRGLPHLVSLDVRIFFPRFSFGILPHSQ